MEPLTGDELTKRLNEGRYKQPIMAHQHFYQVQVGNELTVRWCVNCGKAWKIERYQGRLFGDYWEPILERDEDKE